MLYQNLTLYRYRLIILLSLLFASATSVGMIVARFAYAGRFRYGFLVWNLILAWIPFLFSMLAYSLYKNKSRSRLLVLICGFIWLIFFPNALYILTDFIHLRARDNVPLWFDVILLVSFSWTGCLLGFISLYVIQDLVMRALGRLTGWLFATVVLGLSSFGIYLGRFLRWNSWDLVFNPTRLLLDIKQNLINPLALPKTVTVSFLLSLVFIFTYLILFSLTRIPEEEGRKD